MLVLSVSIILTCVISAIISASGGPDILAKVAEWTSFGLQDLITNTTTTQLAADLAGATVFGVGAVATGLLSFGMYSRNAKSKRGVTGCKNVCRGG